LEELKESAEVLSLHIPLTSETHYLIDEKFISEMKNDFYFVNTARGKM
jgi:D-3-phosphoglycerate dehydrogenase